MPNQTTGDDGNGLLWLPTPALLAFSSRLVLYEMIPFFFSTGPISVRNMCNVRWSLNEQLFNILISPHSSYGTVPTLLHPSTSILNAALLIS